MSESRSQADNQALQVTDLERLKFWKEKSLLTSIPVNLLTLTNWFAYRKEDNIVAQLDKEDNFVVKRLDEVAGDYSVVFKAPQGKYERSILDWVLVKLRQKRAVLDATAELIAANKSAGKDIRQLESLISRVNRPRPHIDSAINAFLDSMRFDVGDIGLSEMRYQSAAKRAALENLRRDMDND